jgi:hypothetical protein
LGNVLAANPGKQALFGLRWMLAKQFKIGVLGEPPVPFCFKMSLIPTQNDMTLCHVELPSQLNPIKASGMPTAPTLLGRSITGFAINQAPSLCREQKASMSPLGAGRAAIGWVCGREGQESSRERLLRRPVPLAPLINI